MPLLDFAVVILYLAFALWFGRRLRGRHGVRDYFLTGRQAPWWAIMASIVATETSTVTVISVPGYAFAGDLTFLQLAFGYVVGRLLVAAFLLPAFFSRDLLSAYQLLTERMGRGLGRAAAVVFLATRNIADGLRLFATAVVLATMVMVAAESTNTAAPSQTVVLGLAIAAIAAVTLAYTWLGGMRAVIWMDVVQLGLYLAGALVAVTILVGRLPDGLAGAWAAASMAGKLTLFDFAWDLTQDYTFWSGVIGGAVFTAATHGADQMFVQRYLCSRSLREARLALGLSGVFVLAQFALFLAIGLLLWAFYETVAPPGALESITTAGALQADQVFPRFLMMHLPTGLRGLVLAAILAAAMSTLSSSLNSSAASTIGDFYLARSRSPDDDARLLWTSRMTTLVWALAQVCVALLAIRLSQRVIDDVLRVQFFAGGLMLGLFVLSTMRTPPAARAGVAGLAVGLAVLLGVTLFTALSWQWYVLVGAIATVGAGALAQRAIQRKGLR
ncbi:MAG: hypothetical protein F4Z04_15040 [Acidobacteria bacterium]|nr:hypothetical protein [Acidobacteriota bacterium]